MSVWRLLCFLSIILMSACSVLSPIPASEQNQYVLNAVPAVQSIPTPTPKTILVMATETNPMFNTVDMVYTQRPYQLANFTHNRWAEVPASMFHTALIQTLRNTHHFHAVVVPPYVGHYDYVLSTRLIELITDFSSTPHVLRLRLHADLMASPNNTLIFSKDFVIEQPIAADTPYDSVTAANHASANILKNLADLSML